MAKPVRIRDGAPDLIRIHSLLPGEDIEIKTTGIRPGEKMYEELLINQDSQEPSPHPKIFVAHDLTVPWDLDSAKDGPEALIVADPVNR